MLKNILIIATVAVFCVITPSVKAERDQYNNSPYQCSYGIFPFHLLGIDAILGTGPYYDSEAAASVFSHYPEYAREFLTPPASAYGYGSPAANHFGYNLDTQFFDRTGTSSNLSSMNSTGFGYNNGFDESSANAGAAAIASANNAAPMGAGAGEYGGGMTRATNTAVPDMIGDSTHSANRFLNLHHEYVRFSNGGSIIATSNLMPMPSFALTRLNIAENFNAEVRDRIYFDYRHFHGAGYYDTSSEKSGENGSIKKQVSSVNVDRYTLGFEKKLGDCSSVEFRLPILEHLSSKQTFCGYDNFSNIPKSGTEFGNISLAYKQVLYRGLRWTQTAGVGLNLPTAPDIKYSLIEEYTSNSGETLYATIKSLVKNEEVRLLPYYALQWHPSPVLFGHFLAQFDVPLNSNEVIFRAESDYASFLTKGKFSDEIMLRLNASVGRWVYIDEYSRFINKIGGVFELHYSVNLESQKDQTVGITNSDNSNAHIGYAAPKDGRRTQNHTHVVNLVGGIPVQIGKTSVTTSVAAPITDARYFSTEVSVQVNRRF